MATGSPYHRSHCPVLDYGAAAGHTEAWHTLPERLTGVGVALSMWCSPPNASRSSRVHSTAGKPHRRRDCASLDIVETDGAEFCSSTPGAPILNALGSADPT